MSGCRLLLGLCAVAVNSGLHDSYSAVVARPASVLIATVAVHWTIERVFL